MIGIYEVLGRRRAPSLNAAVLRWIAKDRSRPFFAFINYDDAHPPNLSPPPFGSQFGEGIAEREPVLIYDLTGRPDYDREVLRKELDAYDGSISYVDHYLGRLFDELGRLGVLDNTILIVSADHGQELGEHGRFGHGNSLRREVIHVPLIIAAPGAPQGVRVRAPVSLRSIPATIAELARFDGGAFPGASLGRHWRQPGTVQDTVLSEYERFQSLYTDQYHFFQGIGRDTALHLFNYLRDPEENNELMGTSEAANVMPAILAKRSAR